MKGKTILYSIIGFLLLTGLVIATTQINDKSVATPQVTWGSVAGLSNQAAVRNMVSTGAVNLTVCTEGCNYTTIQAAINTLPFIIRHQYVIDVRNGAYAEHVFIPSMIVADVTDSTEGSVVGVSIRGNQSDWGVVQVLSFHIASQLGYGTPTIKWFNITGTDPWSDENASIAIYGSNHPTIKECTFDSDYSRIGVLAYASFVTLSNLSLGNNLIIGATVKHGGQIWSLDGGVSGSPNYTYELSGGMIVSKNDTATPDIGAYRESEITGGFLYDNQPVSNYKGFRNVNTIFGALRNLTIDDIQVPVKMNITMLRATNGVGFCVLGFNTSQSDTLLNSLCLIGANETMKGAIGTNNPISKWEVKDGSSWQGSYIRASRGSTQKIDMILNATQNAIEIFGKPLHIKTLDNNGIRIAINNITVVDYNADRTTTISSDTTYSDANTVQMNVTKLRAPNGTLYTCQVNNTGAFLCS